MKSYIYWGSDKYVLYVFQRWSLHRDQSNRTLPILVSLDYFFPQDWRAEICGVSPSLLSCLVYITIRNLKTWEYLVVIVSDSEAPELSVHEFENNAPVGLAISS